MSRDGYRVRISRCAELMKVSRFDALLLTKPANRFYLTGERRFDAESDSESGTLADGALAVSRFHEGRS